MSKAPSIRQEISRSKAYPIFLVVCIYVLCAVFGAYMQEDIAFFNYDWWNHFLPEDYAFTFALVMVCYLCFFITAKWLCRTRFNWKVATWTGILFLCVAIGIICFPDEMSYTFVNDAGDSNTYTYTLDAFWRLKFLLNGLVDSLFLYATLAVLPQLLRGYKFIDFICWLVLILCAISIFWSWYSDYFDYETLFTMSILEGMELSFSSFYSNKNVFGFVLLMGVCASIFLHGRKGHFWHVLIMFFLTAYIVLISCRTGMVAAISSVFIYMLYRFFATFRKHRWLNMLALVVVLSLCIIALLILFGGLLNDNVFISYLMKELKDGFAVVGKDTMSSRGDIYRITIELVSADPISLLFGLGGYNINYLLGVLYQSYGFSEIPIFYTHNGFLEVFGKFGLIGLLIYLAFLIYASLMCFKFMAKKKVLAGSILCMMIAICIEGLGENSNFFGSISKQAIQILMVMLPLFVMIDNEKHAKSIAPVSGELYQKSDLTVNYWIRTLMVVAGIYASFIFSTYRLGFLNDIYEPIITDPWSIWTALLLALFAPRLLMSFGKPCALTRGAFIFGFIFFACFVLCGLYAFFVPGPAPFALACLTMLVTFLFGFYVEGSYGYMKRTWTMIKTSIPFLILFVFTFLAVYYGYGSIKLRDNTLLTAMVLLLILEFAICTLTPLNRLMFPRWPVYAGNFEARIRTRTQEIDPRSGLRKIAEKKKAKKARNLAGKSPSRFVSEED